MARDYFLECQNSIEAELAEIGAFQEFVGSSGKVYANSGAILAQIVGDADLRQLLLDLRKNQLQNLTLLHQSLYVHVWSSFEMFMRQLLTAYFHEFGSQKQDFDSYEKFGFARKNLKQTGLALQHIFENRPNLSVDFFEMAKNASTSVPGSTKVTLNIGAFSIFMSGPTPEGIKDALGRMGIDLNWDDLGRIPEIQKTLRTKGHRETAKQIQDFLKGASKRRNSIVHKSENIESITETDVTEAISIFRGLAKGLIDLAKDDCKRKCG
jgi:RiboL-PSP-HEPN